MSVSYTHLDVYKRQVSHTPDWEHLLELWCGALIIVIVGVADDYFELPAKLKLAGQILAATVFVAMGLSLIHI